MTSVDYGIVQHGPPLYIPHFKHFMEHTSSILTRELTENYYNVIML